MSVPLLSEAPVPVPTPEEQKQIVRRIREARDPLRRLRARLEEQIRLLGERRQALITLAVTGRVAMQAADA